MQQIETGRYCIWRGFGKELYGELHQFVDEQLPAKALPQHLASYEKNVLTTVPPLLRRELQMKIYGAVIKDAPFLSADAQP